MKPLHIVSERLLAPIVLHTLLIVSTTGIDKSSCSAEVKCFQ